MSLTIQKLLEMQAGGAKTGEEKFQQYIEEFGAYLRVQEKIRVFIGDSPYMGHQSSTAQMLFNLVERFGYAKRVEIYYKTEEGFVDVAEDRLRKLFVQLSDAPVEGQVIQIGDATVFFTSKTENLTEMVDFGFTGGADYPVIQDEEERKRVDVAADLKVRFFLRLQPYLWSELEETSGESRNRCHVEYGDRESYPIVDRRIPSVDLDTKIDNFKWLAYKENMEIYQEGYINRMREQIAVGNPEGEKFEKAALLFQKRGNARLWPIYGLHNFDSVTSNGHILLNLVISAMLFQDRGYTEPIIMVMLNENKAELWKWALSVTEAFLSYSREMDSNETRKDGWRMTLSQRITGAESGNKQNKLQEDALNWERLIPNFEHLAHTLLGENKIISERFSVVEDIEELDETKLSERCVYFLELGPVSMGMFKYILYEAGLPPLFEGQGTSSFAMNTGKAYFQVSLAMHPQNRQKGVWYSFHDQNYPSLHDLQSKRPDDGETADDRKTAGDSEIVKTCNEIAMTLVSGIQTFCHTETDGYDVKINKVIDFMVAVCGTEESDFKKYFRSLADYFQQDANEKLSQALLFLWYCIRQYEAGLPVLDEMLGRPDGLVEEEPFTLTYLYQTLQKALTGSSSVDLPEVFPQTALAEYLRSMNGRSFLLSDCGMLQAEYDEKGTLVKVFLTGNLQEEKTGVSGRAEVVFGRQDSSNTVFTELSLTGTEDISMAGIAWMTLEKGGLKVRISEGNGSFSSALTARLKGTNMDVRIPYPFLNDEWYVEGFFETPLSALDAFYKIAGGVHFIQEMPAELRNVGNFGLKDVRLQYNTERMEMEYMEFGLTTESAWTIMENPVFSITPFVDVVIYHVGDLEKRSVSFFITGKFEIGDAVITVKGQYPDFRLDAFLSDGELDLNDFVKMFGGSVDLKAEITQLCLTIYPGQKTYTLCAAVNTDWKLADLFTIKQFCFGVSYTNGRMDLYLSGSLNILPGTLDMGISVSASYQNGGWHFTGEQSGGGVLQAGALLAGYLGWNIDANDLPVLNLSVSYETSGGLWEFCAGTKDPWEVPFISGMKIAGKFRIGRRKQGEGSVSYGRIEAEVTWQKIDLTVWYDYAPDVKSYGFVWNSLEAVLQKDKEGNWVGVIELKKGTSVGEIISTMISWIRGSGFGLEAPWNVLDKIPLPKFQLTYNFTTKQVGFTAQIDEINLGFAKITGICVSYESGNANAGENGVMVSLQGEFPWNTSGENGDTGLLGPWDASEPGAAPVPNGQGNKYFNLNTLALGKHVMVAGLTDAKTIDEVMEKINTLEKPEAGKLPSVALDRSNGWLIGMDFGVLKLTGEGESGYMLRARAIWDDPYLYGLSIQLAGNAAKIFKGLKFEIMYKKLNDTLSVYQGKITLPDVMRRLELGVFSITLPVFAVAVYTNGDFQVDFGFPWNEDFSQSFSIEAVIAPGIPITGAAGFYFGKLSSETSDKVPVCENGLFSPVLVFGIGIKAGFGKSIHWGILDAGFSLTLFVILEGVIAKWNPYQAETSQEGNTQISDSYYYQIEGKAGLLGTFYGTIDFAIIKASLTLDIEVYFKLTYINYQAITIMVGVSAALKLEVSINLGLFKIKIKLSFQLDLKESFMIDQKGNAPWSVKNTLCDRSAVHAYQAMNSLPERTVRMCRNAENKEARFLRKTEERVRLKGYLSAALTAAADEWESGEQKPCYVFLLFMDSSQSFNAFCKAVAGWMIARVVGKDMDEESLNDEMIREDQLEYLKEYLLVSSEENPMPLSLEEINRFMEQHFDFIVECPDPTKAQEVEDAVVFPVVPELTVSLKQQEKAIWSYRLDAYNEISDKKLTQLREYFDELAVQTQKETDADRQNRAALRNENEISYSAASYVYADYFLLTARNMVQQMIETLKNYSYTIQEGETSHDILAWIQENRGSSTAVLDGTLPAYTLYDLFYANQSHLLSSGCRSDGSNEEKQLCLSGLPGLQPGEVFFHRLQEGDTLEKIMAEYGITLEDIAVEEACASYNGAISDLFDAAEEPNLNLPCLSQFRAGFLLNKTMEGEGVSGFGSMASRYYLHGLRLNTEGICPKAKGIWVKEAAQGLALPEEAGLYALTGQQFALPENYENGFELQLEVPEENSWFCFETDGESGRSGILSFGNKEDIALMKELEAYVRNHVLDMGLIYHGQEGMIKKHARTYPYAEVMNCSFGDEISFAYGGKTGGQQVRLWSFGNLLKEWLVSDKRKYDPVFSARAGHLDPASRSMAERMFSRYEPVTVVTFRVKKTAGEENTSCHAYEIMGAGVEDTNRLARLLSQTAQGKVFYRNMYLGYRAVSSSGEQTLIFAPSDAVCFFMVQKNLSTVTHPSNLANAAMEDGINSGVLGDKQELVRLLWEAFITNNGGFYLHYYDHDGEKVTGLQEEVFDEKGEAVLTLLVSYQAEDVAEGQFVLHNYMNALLSDETVDLNTEVCYGQAETLEKRITLDGSESIREICGAYDTDPSGLLEYNPNTILREGTSLCIRGSSYMADDSEKAPGRKLTDITNYFGITLEDLKAANPQKTEWGEMLALYEAVHLPEIKAVIGENTTFETLASFYQVNAAGIAAVNAEVKGIFGMGLKEGARLIVPCGEGIRQTVSQAGVLSVSFTTDAPAEKDIESARELLKRNYTMLSYRILENAEYRQSKMGLPAGPREDSTGGWKYQIDIPYTRLLKEKKIMNAEWEPEQENPYAGIGTLLQMDYSFNDLYGNRIASTLTNQCRKPVAAGYMDSLTPLSAWPSIESWWKVEAGTEAETGDRNPQIVLGISFQADFFAPKGGMRAAGVSAETESTEWYERARRALFVYESLYFQLLDPQGGHYGTETTLFCGEGGETYLYRWNGPLADRLNQWLFMDEKSVYRYLRAVTDTKGDASKYERDCASRIPSAFEMTIPFSDILASGEGVTLNKAEIYELSMRFVLLRNDAKVMSGFEMVSGISEIRTEISPYTDWESSNQTGSTVKAFAASFESAMEQPGVCRYKVAEGANTYGSASANSLWAVRQGTDENQGIYFSFAQQEENNILELPPLSNHLEGEEKPVVIPAYREREEQKIYFRFIDMDNWMRIVLESLEAMTDPVVLNMLRILDADGKTAYYEEMLAHKKGLAEGLSGLLTEVFEGETVGVSEKEAAKESLYQNLLVSLTEFYHVQGAIFAKYLMNASPEPESADAPRILGKMNLDAETAKTNISISQIKLPLQSAKQAVQACLVTAPGDVRDEEGGILSELDMALSFVDLELEHQISEVEGIEGYRNSSWLKFVFPEDSLFRKTAGTVKMPLLLRNYPDIPKLEEQKCETAERFDQEGANIYWDYVFSYSRPYHYPQDEISCHVEFNKMGQTNKTALEAKKALFTAMAVFTTLREALETDINGFAAQITPDFGKREEDDAKEDVNEAVQMYLSCMEKIVMALKQQNLTDRSICGLLQGLPGISCDFTVQEKVKKLEEADVLAIIVQGMLPGEMKPPVVEILPEQYEAITVEMPDSEADGDSVTKRMYCYRDKETGKLLSAVEGQKIPERYIRITDLHLLNYQSADTNICIRRNAEEVDGKKVRDCFVYQTGEIGFGTTLYPSFDFSQAIDMTTYAGKTAETGTVFEQLQSFFERLLGKGDYPEITLQVEVTYRRLIKEVVGYSDVPVFFQLPVNSAGSALEEMEKQWSDRLNDWYMKNIGLEGKENWKKDDILVFDLLFMTNQTAEPMPLLRFRNLQLPCRYIEHDRTR